MAEPAVPYAVLAEFATPERLTEAARILHKRGCRQLEAFTPFPVEGLPELLGYRDAKVPTAMLIGGIAGALLGFLMQVYTNLDFPIRIGGRGLIAVPAFILITFEMLVLGAVLSGIATMLIANRLPRLNHPVFEADRFDLSANDRFFLAILADESFDRDGVGKALADLKPHAIIEVP